MQLVQMETQEAFVPAGPDYSERLWSFLLGDLLGPGHPALVFLLEQGLGQMDAKVPSQPQPFCDPVLLKGLLALDSSYGLSLSLLHQ